MNRIHPLLAITLLISLIIASSAFTTHQTSAVSLTSPTSTPQPVSTVANSATPSGPPLSLTLSLICVCLVFLLIIGVIVLGVAVRKENMEALNKDKN